MRIAIRLFSLLCVFSLVTRPAPAQPRAETEEVVQAIGNWPAPLLWTAPASRTPEGARTEAAATVSAPLPFIAITPCRVADTRGNGFTGAYGPPALVASATRNFTITGQCGIPVTAAAVSFNFAALNVGGVGDLRVFPAGGGVPLVSTLNYNANTPNIANAAVVPLGTGGAITVQADAVSIDLIIDVNGYYDNSGLITSVMPGTGLMGGGTSGTVSLGIAPGGVTSTELASNAVTSAKIAANAVTAGAIATGQVVKNVNGVTDSVTVSGSGLVSVNTVGSTITVGGGGVPSGSFVLGNSGDSTLIGAGYTETGFTQDFWKATATAGAPPARQGPQAVWTGTKMIVWGGLDASTFFNTGGQYDPAANSWTATATTNAPTGRVGHTAVWTGSKMIVWGGSPDTVNGLNTGGQYDPVGDSWAAGGTATTNAPSARAAHTAIWTGTKMIIWGGATGFSTWFNTGGLYDPVGDSWTIGGTATTNAPTARALHSAVWTGTEMVIWGGYDGTNRVNTGGQYDPGGNSWMAGGTTTTGAPTGRQSHTAVWTGTKMIVWGGNSGTTPYFNTGGIYDPAGNSWTAGGTTTSGAPADRTGNSAVWTGSRMIVWGGIGDAGSVINTGGLYDPVGNSWATTTTLGAPAGRTGFAAVWTGSKMIVWGGLDGTTLNTGGQYTLLSVYSKN
jgi:hypothetical protein